MKATITLEGPATYTEPGRPSFRRGVPVLTGNESVILWAKGVGFLKVEVLEEGPPPKPPSKPKPTPKPVPKKAAPKPKPVPKKAAPKPKPKPEVKKAKAKKATKKKTAKKKRG